MTQYELSELTGISKPTISLLCRNATGGMKYEQLEKIVVVLGLTDIRELIVMEVLDD